MSDGRDTQAAGLAGQVRPPAVPADVAMQATIASRPGDATLLAPGASVSPPPLALTTVLREHYEVGAELARGGMGRILVAEDRRLGRQVAIKELLADSGDLRARFEREARITARLQHPSIVNLIEAGTWPSGEPFYVMKLVSGDSLDKVIARATTLNARLALLPTVIAVVEALAYAHSRRVIHRDLKPANVLVGEFGETVVIDWGLAKELDAADDPAASLSQVSGNAGETVAGSIMGTPSYMSPEQAKGLPVDERTDVYALGALLYHVLGGEPPYKGPTSESILIAVIEGAPRALGAQIAGVPPELVAIVAKAMARDPAARYPNARDLAGELKKFQAGQLVEAHHYTAKERALRWVRKHRVRLSVAAVGLAVLLVAGGAGLWRVFAEQTRTEEQRVAAETNRRDAESLIGFMLGEVHDKLEGLGKLEILQSVATRAGDYYAARDTHDLTGDELWNLWRVHRGIADVLHVKGGLERARREAAAMRDIDERLAGLAPASQRYRWGRANTAILFGDLDRDAGDTEAAQAEYTRAFAIADDGRGASADDPEVATLLAIVHLRLGDIALSRGQMTASEAHFQTALDMAERAERAAPTDARAANLASVHEDVGAHHRALGDYAGAAAQFQAALTIDEELLTVHPADVRYRRSAARHRCAIGDVTHDLSKAVTIYRAALVDRDLLVAVDPSNGGDLYEQADTHVALSSLLAGLGDVPGALKEAQAALRTATALAARAPDNMEWQRQDAAVEGLVAQDFSVLGDGVNAEVHARASLEILRRIAGPHADAILRSELGRALDAVGTALLAGHKGPEAVDVLREEEALWLDVLAKAPTNADFQLFLGSGRDNLGDALAMTGKLEDAITTYRAGLAEVATHPDTAADILRSILDESIGDVRLQQGKRDDAAAAFRAALEVRNKLAAHDPAAGTKAAVDQVAKKLAALGR